MSRRYQYLLQGDSGITSTNITSSNITIPSITGGSFATVSTFATSSTSGYTVFNGFNETTFDVIPVILQQLGGNVGIGNTTPGYTLDVSGTIYASGDITALSDIRKKTDITTIDNALEKVESLRGVYFKTVTNDKRNMGVIAQEIEEVIPEVVLTAENGYKSVAYGNITGLLIQAIKELNKELTNNAEKDIINNLIINAQKDNINNLIDTVNAQNDKINTLQNKIDDLEEKINQLIQN